jgi:hypothetical protein
MKGTLETIVLMLCVANLCAVTGVAQIPPTARRQPALNEVMSWLPDDTETITGVNGPIRVPEVLSDGESSEMRRETLESQMQAFTLGLFFGFKNGGLQEMLKGKTVVLAVEGSRHFRSPVGLGLMRYEGCEIAVFSGAVPLDRDSFMKKAASSAKRFETIDGVIIAIFEEKSEEDLWTTFVGFPRNNVVLVATDADFLRTVLARMRSASGPRALPDSLTEWKYVNTRASVWGLRHYQRGRAELDDTSPFNREGSANLEDDRAVGVAFWFAPASQRMTIVTYLSRSSKARQTLRDYLTSGADPTLPPEVQIRFSSPAPGVTQGSVKWLKPEGFYGMFLGLMGMLGHAIYL